MKKALVPLLICALWLGACGQGGQGTDSGQADQGVIRVALGDIESVETLALFIALERVRERGIEVELIELADEDLANQAVVGGQADVGLGAPYGLIEGSARSAADLLPAADACGSSPWSTRPPTPTGSRSTARRSRCTRGARRPRRSPDIIEQEEGIEFGEISYVPGRGGARDGAAARQRQGRRARHPEQELRDERGARQVPRAADARDRSERRGAVRQHRVAEAERGVGPGPARGDPHGLALDRRGPLVRAGRSASGSGLLPDLPPELEKELLPYYEQAAEEGLFTQDCGGLRRPEEDFEFYHTAGQLKGDPATLKVEDFWNLEPLQTAVQHGRGIRQLTQCHSFVPARVVRAVTGPAGPPRPLGACLFWASGSGPAGCRSTPPSPPSAETLAAFGEMLADGTFAGRLRRDDRPAHRRRAAHRRSAACSPASSWASPRGRSGSGCPCSSSCRPRRRRRSSR